MADPDSRRHRIIQAAPRHPLAWAGAVASGVAVLILFAIFTDFRSHASASDLERVETQGKERDLFLAAESKERTAEVSGRLDAHVKIAEVEFNEQAEFRGMVEATLGILLQRSEGP